jgi:hypothetical protein
MPNKQSPNGRHIRICKSRHANFIANTGIEETRKSTVSYGNPVGEGGIDLETANLAVMRDANVSEQNDHFKAEWEWDQSFRVLPDTDFVDSNFHTILRNSTSCVLCWHGNEVNPILFIRLRDGDASRQNSVITRSIFCPFTVYYERINKVV